MDKDYCDKCKDFKADEKTMEVGCGKGLWWNEPRIAPKDKGIGFSRPFKCKKWIK